MLRNQLKRNQLRSKEVNGFIEFPYIMRIIYRCLAHSLGLMRLGCFRAVLKAMAGCRQRRQMFYSFWGILGKEQIGQALIVPF